MNSIQDFRSSMADMTSDTFEWMGGTERAHLNILLVAFRFWCDTAPDGDAAPLMPLLLPAWGFWCEHAPDADFEDTLDELVELDFRQQARERRDAGKAVQG